MKYAIYCITLIFIYGQELLAQTPNWTWADNGNGISIDEGYSLTTDIAGNVYVTGFFLSPTITFGNIVLTNYSWDGYSDMFLVKYDEMGNLIWAKSSGGLTDDRSLSITVSNLGDIYITGHFDSDTIMFDNISLINNGSGGDVFIVKYNSSGNVIWAKREGSLQSESANSIVSDTNGNIFIMGSFAFPFSIGNNALTSAGYGDIFIAKYDSFGNPLWAKSAGGSVNDGGYGLAIDVLGNIIITGSFGSSVMYFDNTDIFHFGTICLLGCGDIFVAKYNSSGELIWANRYGSENDDVGQDITTDSDGNIYFTGWFWSNNDSVTFEDTTFLGNALINYFVSKLDSSGNIIWVKTAMGLNNNSEVSGFGISSSINGSVYTTGRFSESTITFGNITLTNSSTEGTDIFVVKYDMDGNEIWAIKPSGGGEFDVGWAIAATEQDAVFITGFFSGVSIAFGNSNLINSDTSGYGTDVFVARIDSGITSGTFGVIKNNVIGIYPNPATTQLTITGYTPAYLKLCNTLGQTLAEATNTNTLWFGNLPQGLYLLQLFDAKGSLVKTEKVVKE